MRRTVLVVCTVCLSAAQAPAAEKVVSIPLARVVLFAGGSGYFEHDGTVEGSAATVLSFRADRLGEILKTLVLTDLGGGRITVVSYGPPRGPGGKAPAMDLRGATSVADVLARLRGVEVVVLAPDKITGKIAGVETRPAKDGAGRDTTIDLVTPTGLRRVEMAGVTSVTPTDPAVRDELARALLRVIEDEDLRKTLAEGGRKRAEDFAIEKIAARYDELFDDLLSHRDSGIGQSRARQSSILGLDPMEG